MLKNFVAIYVPSTRHGEPITDAEHQKAVELVAADWSRGFGGCTAIPATGYWKSPELGLIPEKITIVKSFYDLATVPSTEAQDFARGWADRIKETFQQEAVTIETEEGIEFI